MSASTSKLRVKGGSTLQTQLHLTGKTKCNSNLVVFLRNVIFVLLALCLICFVTLGLYFANSLETQFSYLHPRKDVHLDGKDCQIWGIGIFHTPNTSIQCQHFIERKSRGAVMFDGKRLPNMPSGYMFQHNEEHMEYKVTLSSDDHTVKEERYYGPPWSETKQVLRNGEDLSFTFKRPPNVKVHFLLYNISILPEYVDVMHSHSDNGIVLDTSRRSNMHHWRTPLQSLLDTKCRHPLPKQYYLMLHPYLDRHTIARRRLCKSKFGYFLNSTNPPCPSGIPHNSIIFERSINDQCTQNQASFLPPQRNSIYCTSNSPLVNEMFNEYVNEKQSYLKDTQCDTHRRLCQTCLRRSCLSKQSTSYTNQGSLLNGFSLLELANDIIWLRDPRTETRNTSNDQCCGTACYSTPSCVEYFSQSCQAQTINHENTQEVCLQGKTFKLTLNPEFEFTNGSYMCHVQYNPPTLLYTVKSWLSINGTLRVGPKTYTVSLPIQDHQDRSKERTPTDQSYSQKSPLLPQHLHGFVWLWGRAIQIEHKLSKVYHSEAILRREPTTGQISLHKLKLFEEFGTKMAEIQQHRDEKYVTLQFTRPFIHSTESWGNQSCYVNISHFHRSQPIYSEQDKMNVRLASPISRKEDGSFSYVVDDFKESTLVRISSTPGRSVSFLRSAICDSEMSMSFQSGNGFIPLGNGRFVDHSELNIVVSKGLLEQINWNERQGFRETWNVTVTGWITKKPAYLHAIVLVLQSPSTTAASSLTWTSKRNYLLEEDIIILPTTTELDQLQRNNSRSVEYKFITLRFTVHLKSFQNTCHGPKHIQIILSDCLRTKKAQVPLYIEQDIHCSSTNGNQTTASEPQSRKSHFSMKRMEIDRFFVPFMFSCVLTVSAHIILLIIYIFVQICNRVVQVGSADGHVRSITPVGNSTQGARPFADISGNPQQTVRMTATRKAFLMLYLCFRVFYTFLFTISVGLAFLLSTEYIAARDLTAVLHNRELHISTVEFSSKLAAVLSNSKEYSISSVENDGQEPSMKHWVAEVMKLEEHAHSELTKQLQSIRAQNSECAEQKRTAVMGLINLIQMAKKHGKQLMAPATETISLMHAVNTTVDDANELKHRRLKLLNLTWTTDPLSVHVPSLQRTTWKLLEQSHWSAYLDRVDEHLRKIRDELDTQVIDHWTPFDRLLGRLLENTWIAPARRALNATWLRVKSSASNSASAGAAFSSSSYNEYEEQPTGNPLDHRQRMEITALKLAKFLGMPQPEQARLTGARIWNNFKRFVSPLPNHFYYNVGRLHQGSSQLSERIPIHTIFTEHRYMFSTDDQQVAYGTEYRFGASRRKRAKFYRYTTHLHKTAKFRSSGSAVYLLNLTQVRLLVLALDGFIILARCFSTYHFMRHIWHGKVKRVHLHQIQSSLLPSRPTKLSELRLLVSGIPGFIDAASGEHNSASYVNSANVAKNEPHSPGLNTHVFQPTELGTTTPLNSVPQNMLYHQLQPCILNSSKRFDSHRLIVRSADVSSDFNGRHGQLTACYCCLDDHYLVVVLGVGLLLVGLLVVWAADRHIRPGSLMARSSIYPRTRALEQCFQRTNTIMKTLQRVYGNGRNSKDHRREAEKESRRMEQTLRRFRHEQVQLYELYLAELCTIGEVSSSGSGYYDVKDKTQLHRPHTPGQDNSSVEAMRMFSTSPCILFDHSMKFTKQFRQKILRHMRDTDRDVTLSLAAACTYSAPFYSISTPDQPRQSLPTSSLGSITGSNNRDMIFEGNRTVPKKGTHADLVASVGGLAVTVYACHRLILTGLTIALTAGGLISLLHLIKLMLRQAASFRIRKVVLITPYPAQTCSSTVSTASSTAS